MIADEPQCGWFKMRLIKGGPWVPVRILCEQQIDDDTGELIAPEQMWAQCGIERDARTVRAQFVWPHCAGKPITEEEWRALFYAQDVDIAEATHAKVDLARKAIRP